MSKNEIQIDKHERVYVIDENTNEHYIGVMRDGALFVEAGDGLIPYPIPLYPEDLRNLADLTER